MSDIGGYVNEEKKYIGDGVYAEMLLGQLALSTERYDEWHHYICMDEAMLLKALAILRNN